MDMISEHFATINSFLLQFTYKKIFKSHLPNPAPSLGKEECHFSLCSLLRKLGLQQSYKLVKRSVHLKKKYQSD